MKLSVRPLTPERRPDVAAVFNAKGCAVARGCWCVCYRRGGAHEPSQARALLVGAIAYARRRGNNAHRAGDLAR